jgi:hypothetical protein
VLLTVFYGFGALFLLGLLDDFSTMMGLFLFVVVELFLFLESFQSLYESIFSILIILSNFFGELNFNILLNLLSLNSFLMAKDLLFLDKIFEMIKLG